MLLLEIGYSEKYDTYTGYVCNQGDYSCFEITRDKVKLTPIRQEFESYKAFVDEFSKRNPHVQFLTDPVKITALNYSQIKRYKRLLPTTVKKSHTLISSPFKKAVFAGILICLVAISYLAGQHYYVGNFQQATPSSSPSTVEIEPLHYYYEVHLLQGGVVHGFDLKENAGNVVVTNRKGLDVTVELASVKYIEKIESGNSVVRSVIYGSKL